MNRKALLVMWLFLCISGVILRIVNNLITPAMQHLFFQGASAACILYMRTICKSFCTIILFYLFLRLRKLYSSFSDSALTLSTNSVALSIALIAILLKIFKNETYISFVLWTIGFPVDGYLNLVSILSGTYDFGSVPIYLFVPSIFAPYLFLHLLKSNKKKIEQA